MIILGPVAVANNAVMGKDNDLPWHFAADLQHFKKLTVGHTVLMGRKTFASIMQRLGKPLPQRKNVVITRQVDYPVPPGVLVFNDLLCALHTLTAENIYVIGGAEILRQVLPWCERAYLTAIHDNYSGDTFFPTVDWREWQKLAEEHHAKFSFITYSRSLQHHESINYPIIPQQSS